MSFQAYRTPTSVLEGIPRDDFVAHSECAMQSSTGVKRLEELLIDGDADSTGFVNLKQLSWVLTDQFDFRISETRLIEVCLGMNFDAHAQLDYREFVDVLLDILIYELPDIRESAKRKSLIRLDQYLQSGFPPGQEGTRQLLDALCSKYALKGDQCITVAELVRVLHVDLIKYHALALPFPLGEHETIQLARPFIQHGVNEKSGDGILSYTELLDALLGPFPFDFRPEGTGNEKPKRVLQWEFWHSIYMSLCGGDSMITQKVLAQLEKILAKVDPTTTFMMSTRHFRRIFERHISSDDMDVLLVALRVQDDTESTLNSGSEPPVRYDVLMKLVFGVPELNDSTFFENCVRKKLLREQDRLRAYTTDLVTVQGASHTLTLEDFYDTFVVQADLYPLAMVEMLFWFASLDFDHKGSVQLKSLIDVLKHKCWRAIKYSTVANVTFREHEVANHSCNTESIRKLIAKCCSSYNLYDVLVNISHKTQGQITTSVMHEELNKMLHELGVVGVHQDDLKCLLQIVARKSKGECPSVNTRDLIHYDAFFDELFDWKTLVSSMRLPHSLVDVKKVLEKFDWEHVGTIHCVDWSKAYRLICGGTAAMAEWEVRVLYQRFPGQEHHSEQSNKIDYARLLVFLLDYQLRQARESLQRLVIEHFRQKFGSADKPVSTSEMEQVFRSLDTDNKGYFNTIDLKNYLLKEFESQSTQESDDLIPLLHSSDALSSVMNLLVGIKTNEPDYHSANSSSPAVVRFDHFRNIGSFLTTPKNASSVLGQMIYPLQPRGRLSGENAHGEAASHIISSLRVLEITILDISSEFADSKGNILPTRAFRYLSFGPSAPPTRQSPQRSPLRRSALGSPTNPRVVLAGTIRTKKRELEASLLDPLTPARLKQILQIYRNIKWAAPLSIEIQGKVRNVVRQMVVKGKGGGGRLDLDRFLAQLKRRLQDAPDYISTSGSSESSPPQSVSMALLLSKLHQLNIPLHKQELMALLRHFGMEDDLEAVDYGLFIQRLYELNSVGTLP
ncbi:unnamed protein product [Phytophthora lilii]|uniref:Unnamed protein product n=1 Tax=Phytophthora lilii TaxID=2077276 RepID=A0A9W6TCF9_9STRA|nr:unnamed protein product [Phytophthora lilii]